MVRLQAAERRRLATARIRAVRIAEAVAAAAWLQPEEESESAREKRRGEGVGAAYCAAGRPPPVLAAAALGARRLCIGNLPVRLCGAARAGRHTVLPASTVRLEVSAPR